jgi:uncharacterized damage-inducible protein DinB
MRAMQRPDSSEYASFYAGYVARVPEDDILSAFEQQSSETQRLISSIDDDRARYRYAEGKWSIKEVLGHVTDGERIFAYRALCIARGDTSSLPGFDENAYMTQAAFDSWRIGELAESYALTRRSNIVMLRNLPEEAWTRRGMANDAEITVRALAYIMVGHERHHMHVLRERYLI